MISTKTALMKVGGERGSSRNLWWISGLLVYRSGGVAAVGALFWSCWILSVKASWLYGLDEPKEPMTIDALSGFALVRNWMGKSL
jgi:hypothetical protein